MNISLTPQLEQAIQNKVNSGYYNNASEVVRESLRMMLSKEAAENEKLKTLRRDIQNGLKSGSVDGKKAMARIKAKLNKKLASA